MTEGTNSLDFDKKSSPPERAGGARAPVAGDARASVVSVRSKNGDVAINGAEVAADRHEYESTHRHVQAAKNTHL